MDEWELLPIVRGQIEHLTRAGELRESRDELGRLTLRFPRLAIRWSAFKPPQDVPEFQESAQSYWYAGPQGKEQGLSATQILSRVQQAPKARHRIFASGWPGWKDAGELETVRFHYAVDGTRKGVLSAQEIADLAWAAPGSVHKVWTKDFGRTWKAADQVDEITARMGPAPLDEGPPPLDEDAPPPLD